MGKLEASKKPARDQEEASKRPARSQQQASKTPARGQQETSKRPARGQQEAKKPARGPKWGGPHETPKPLKNSHFHEENSPCSRAFPKTDFLEKSSWGSLKPARSQQEASKRPARSQQEARKKPGRGPKWGGPHETPKPLKNNHFMKRIHRFREPSQKPIF